MKKIIALLILAVLTGCGTGSDDAGKVYLPRFNLPYGYSKVLIHSYPELHLEGEIGLGELAMQPVKRPGSDELWVCCEGSRDIAVIDSRSDSLMLRFRAGQAAQSGAFTPDGSVFVVTHGAQIAFAKGAAKASIIDAGKREILATVDVGADPIGVVISPDGLEAYVAGNGDHTITRIDLASRAVIATVDTGPGPFTLSIDGDAGRLYAACRGKDENSSGAVYVHGLPNLEVLEIIESRAHPVQVLPQTGAFLLLEASRDGRGRLRRFHPESGLVELLSFEQNPGPGSLSPSGRWLLTILGGQEVVCVDLESNRIHARRRVALPGSNSIIMNLGLD